MTSSPTPDAASPPAEAPAPLLLSGPETGPALLLAHGAGAPMDSAFMDAMASLLAERGVATIRFEFPYMRKRRADGRKRPPDRAPALEAAFRAAYAAAGRPKLFIGGKSMGGRIAASLADEIGAAGLVCLGFPFHPPGKPERTRIEALGRMQTPTLIVQGERDPFGKPDDVAGYRLSDAVRLFWSANGDHDLKPRKASGLTHPETLAVAADEVARFMRNEG